LVDPVAEFLLAPGQRGEAALAAGPIAGHGVEQRETQAIALEPLGDRLGRVVVGNRNSTPVKPARAAASNRSRKPMSWNIMLKLAAN